MRWWRTWAIQVSSKLDEEATELWRVEAIDQAGTFAEQRGSRFRLE